jgi:DNA-binding Lrp family transcriptional regulator
MDATDHRIVVLLQENARRSFQDIGTHVGLTAPAVKRRVDRLEEQGVIRGYAAIVDPASIGWPTHAIVSLVCEGRMPAAQVKQAVARHPEVVSAFTVAGEAAAVVHVRARDNEHLERTLERLREAPGIIRTQSQIVLSTLLERPVFSPD